MTTPRTPGAAFGAECLGTVRPRAGCGRTPARRGDAAWVGRRRGAGGGVRVFAAVREAPVARLDPAVLVVRLPCAFVFLADGFAAFFLVAVVFLAGVFACFAGFARTAFFAARAVLTRFFVLVAPAFLAFFMITMMFGAGRSVRCRRGRGRV